MSELTNKTVEKVLAEIVEDLVQDWGLDLDEGITEKTLLVNELEFASVDIIQLCVAIEQHYEQKIGFQDLLMKNGSYISDLSIAQLTDFVTAKLNMES